MRYIYILSYFYIYTLWALDPTLKSQSMRDTIVESRPWSHTSSEVRTGFFSSSAPISQEDSSTLATGGHLHLISDEYFGLNVSAMLYAVGSVSFNGTDRSEWIVSDDRPAFALLPEAYIAYRYKGRNITVGRQTFNTPYIDSDDWAMMPNYFTAATVKDNTYEHLKLRAGYVYDSAGSGNRVAPQKFVTIAETYGAKEDTAGVVYAGAQYGERGDYALSLWGYRFFDLADVIYSEAKTIYLTKNELILSLGIQGSVANDSGESLVGEVSSRVLGSIVRIDPVDVSFGFHMAWNRAYDGQIFSYIGGGPYYTSMEALAIDDIGADGRALNGAFLYSHKDHNRLKSIFTASIGRFSADERGTYDIMEYDIAMMFDLDSKIDVTLAYAFLEDLNREDEGSFLLRSVINYRFSL